MVSAATLLGAASVIRDEIHTPIASAHRAAYEQLVGDARSVLGDERYNEAWQAGRALSAGEAVALAREQIGLMGEAASDP